MSQKSDALLLNEKEVIKTELDKEENTQVRIGEMLENIIDSKINNDKIVDEDDMASDSATRVPTQQSVKKYVDDNTNTESGGTLISGHYDFSTATAAADPGAGVIRLNSSAFVGVSAIYVDNLNKNGDDASSIFSSLTVGDRLRVQLESDPTNYIFVRLTALPVNNTGWWTMPVAVLASQGAIFADTADLILTVIFASVVPANESVAGVSEEATDAELVAGTGVGGSGARLFVNPEKLKTYLSVVDGVVDLGNLSGAVSINLALGKNFKCAFTGSVTSFTFTNEVVGRTYSLDITRVTTNYTIAFTAGKFRFPLGQPIVLTNPATNGVGTAIDKLTFFCGVAGRLDVVITPDLQNN